MDLVGQMGLRTPFLALLIVDYVAFVNGAIVEGNFLVGAVIWNLFVCVPPFWL
jgi:hypothetical protein